MTDQAHPYYPPPTGAPYDPAQPAPAADLLGVEYHRIYRSGRQGWGWYAGGIIVSLLLFFVVAAVVVLVGSVVVLLLTGTQLDEIGARISALTNTDEVTPSVLVFLNAVLILGIPIAFFCTRVLHGVRPRWLASVAPRIRWRWLLASFGVALVSLVLAIVLGAFLPGASESQDVVGGVNDWTDLTRDFLLVIVLMTPLQAVAEEYVFRGYLTQAFGGLVRHAQVARYLAVIGPALLFALAHGAGQSAPVFFDRLAFGVVAGVLVIATGGLEAAIAYHVLNNLLAFGFALFFSDMTEALNATGGGWSDVLVSVVKSATFVVLSIFVARRMGLQTRTKPGVLEGSVRRV